MLPGCSWDGPQTIENDGIFRVSMVPDLGGVNDQSFNQSAWEGLKEFSNKTGAQVSYMEPKQSSDFLLNLDKLSDGNSDLILGIGYVMSDPIEQVSKLNLDKSYAIVDYAFEEGEFNNVTGVVFRSQESAFMVGYIAGRTTKTHKVGFIGGMKNPVIDQFESGYKAGLLWAAKEIGKNIDVVVQYADSFSDEAKGKAIAYKMYSSDKCDVIFHAAGGVGYGVIEAAKDTNRYVIGVDRDQSYIAPDNVLTSAIKNVGAAVEIVSKKKMDGEEIGGTNFEFGIKENWVGIPETNKILDPTIYQDTMKIAELIKDETIKVPYNLETYKEFEKRMSDN